MLKLLRAELEREFDADAIHRVGVHYLGLDPSAVPATTPAEAAAALVERCAENQALEALADVIVVERPSSDRRLASVRREGYRAAETLTAGSTVGPYTLYAALGVGPDSTVFRARDGERVVRLRLMRQREASDRHRLNRFLAAARVAADVTEKRLPAGLHAVSIGDRDLVVHDLFEGEPFAARAAEPMPLRTAWPILRGVLSGLGALHTRGLVHGALHAGNVLVGKAVESPPVMLLDAGAYMLRAGGGVAGAGLARVHPVAAAWTSPEQLLGELPTARSDVYSFAMLMYALLAGRLPVPADAPDLVRQRLAADPDPLSFLAPHGAVPDELEEIVLRLVDREPSRRPPDANAVFELLAAVVSTVPATTSAMPDVDVDQELEKLLADPANETRAAVLEAAIERGLAPRRVADAFVLAAEQLEPGAEAGDARRRLLIRAGALYENLVGDLAASERTYRQVIQQDPSSEGAWMALERIFRRAGNYDKLVDLLLERRDLLKNHAERARVLSRLARVLSHDVGDEPQAIVALTEAVAEDPANDAYAHELESLVKHDRSSWGGVLETLASSAGAEPDAERRCRLWVRLGGWYELHVGRLDLALGCYQAAGNADPVNELVLERMASIYRRAQSWNELAQILLAQARITAAPAVARDLKTEAAGALLEGRGPTRVGQDLLEQVLAEDPSHAEAGRLLANLLLQGGKAKEWIEIMERRAGYATGAERREILADLARRQTDQIKDVAGAISTWEHLLQDDPSDVEALRALEAAYLVGGRPDKVVPVLEKQLAMALTPAQRVAILERIAGLCEKDLLDDAGAVVALERLLEIDPDHVASLERLAALYRRLRRWNSLALTLERLAEHVHDPAARIEAWLELARLATSELGEPTRALAMYERVLEIEPANRAALDAAAKLRAKLGDMESASDALDKLAGHESSPEASASAWIQAAEARLAQGDVDGALERFRRALDALPGHARAACEMATLLISQREVSAAIASLEHALPRAQSGAARAEIGGALARILLEEQDDAGRAGAAVAVALGHDPTNPMVHFVAGELERRAGNSGEAAQHFEKAALHLERFLPTTQVRILAGQVGSLARVDRSEDARRRLEILVERLGTRKDALEAASALALDVSSPERGLELTERLLKEHEAAFSRGELAGALGRKGELLRRLGRLDEARTALEAAAAADRQDVGALKGLVELHRDAGRKPELESAAERLLERLTPSEHRDLMVWLGDLAAEALPNTEIAARSYLRVLGENSDDRRTLLRLMRLYSDAEDWGRLVEVILKLAGMTSDHAEKARYIQMAARIADNEQNDLPQAAELYDAVLRLDPQSEDSVARAIALHSRLGHTERVRQILEQQIAHASAGQDRNRAYRLATALADLDLGELQVDDAIAINEAALELVSADTERENVLADLYMTDAKQYLHRAARLQRKILARDPQRPEPYRRLRQLGIASGRLDAAFCACQVLTALKHANPEEEAYYSEHRRGTLINSSARVGEAEWAKLVVHPNANPTLTSLLVQIHPVVASKSRGVSLEELGLDEKAALVPERHQGTLVQAFRRASEVLRSPMPLLFEKPDQKTAVLLGKGARPHVLLSSAAVNKPFSERRAAFIAASSTILLRPGYMLRILLTAAELKAWVLGAIRLVAPKFVVAAELEDAVKSTHRQLDRHLPSMLQKRVGDLLETMLKAGGQADLTRWVAGVDLTADRSGLLFANGLRTALEVIRASGDSALSLTATERANQLLRYAVSSEYLGLRNALRLSVDRSEQEELEADDIAG